MGGCVVTFGFNDKIKTVAQAQKDFEVRAEQDRYENGHSYSGTMGMLNRLRPVSQVFDSAEQFEQFLCNQQKNDGFIAQVKVVRETKPLIAARVKLAQMYRAAFEARTPGQKKTANDRIERAKKRVDELYAKQAAKATKTKFIAGGVCSS